MRRTRHGFTLVELMVAMSLATIVIAGVLSAYTFLGRNLAKLVSRQQLQAKNQSVFQFLAKDVATATSVVTATDTTCTFTFSTGPNITYAFANRQLTRGGVILQSDITFCDFNYFKNSGAATTTAQEVKLIELNYRAEYGATTDGTTAAINVATATHAAYVSTDYTSPRLLMRNKALLQ
jgi:prepilin-type N-terminal cleavage/methylation domain-containing protein